MGREEKKPKKDKKENKSNDMSGEYSDDFHLEMELPATQQFIVNKVAPKVVDNAPSVPSPTRIVEEPHLAQSGSLPFITVRQKSMVLSRACPSCKRPYDVSNLSREVVTALCGGFCFDCHRSAASEQAREYLRLQTYSPATKEELVAENDLLRKFITRLQAAFQVSVKLAEIIRAKNTRRKTLEMSKITTVKPKVDSRSGVHIDENITSLKKHLAAARRDLSVLQATHKRLTDADLLMQLQATARNIDAEVDAGNRNLRALRTEFGRREAQRARKARQGEIGSIDNLKSELETLRVKNEELKQKISSEHAKLVQLMAKESELSKSATKPHAKEDDLDVVKLRDQVKMLREKRDRQDLEMRRKIKEESDKVMRLELEITRQISPRARQFVKAEPKENPN